MLHLGFRGYVVLMLAAAVILLGFIAFSGRSGGEGDSGVKPGGFFESMQIGKEDKKHELQRINTRIDCLLQAEKDGFSALIC